MKKGLLILALALLLGATAATAATVVGTQHDLKLALTTSQQVCVFCHTPHQPTAVTTDPLWNHTLSAVVAYGIYASNTLNATPAEITGTGSVSLLCMSCHDGTVAPGSLYNNPNIAGGLEETPGAPWGPGTMITGNSNMGTSLANDHPVNFTYDGTLVTNDGGLVAVGSLPTWALVGGKVECSSCHDPHNATFLPFLNATNVGSALCIACHVK